MSLLLYSFGQIAKEVGMKNLFTKGLGTRVLMIGTLTGFQWWIYDTFKVRIAVGTKHYRSTEPSCEHGWTIARLLCFYLL